MTIELTPDIEAILLAESSATGLSPAETTLRVLTTYVRSRPQSQFVLDQGGTGANTTSLEPEVPDEVIERRRAAVARILARRNASSAPRLNLPEGMTLRDYIHEGHRY